MFTRTSSASVICWIDRYVRRVAPRCSGSVAAALRGAPGAAGWRELAWRLWFAGSLSSAYLVLRRGLSLEVAVAVLGGDLGGAREERLRADRVGWEQKSAPGEL